MNKRGNTKSLVASHPGNLNAAKQGVHSPRLIQARAAEIASELTQAFEFSPTEQLAVYEAARCIAILEAIDRDLDERGLVDKEGKPRYLLNHRSRTSRQLEQWLDKVTAAIERKAIRVLPDACRHLAEERQAPPSDATRPSLTRSESGGSPVPRRSCGLLALRAKATTSSSTSR